MQGLSATQGVSCYRLHMGGYDRRLPGLDSACEAETCHVRRASRNRPTSSTTLAASSESSQAHGR